MLADSVLPENIQSLLDQAELSLLRGKHGEASTFFWKATEAAISQTAKARVEPSERAAIPVVK